MARSKEQMDAMGTLNNPWGVCGFTSSLYALYENSPTLRGELTSGAKVSTRVVAEIKSFLVQLEADGNSKTLAEIASFTSSFAGFGGFTIADYIRRINAVAAKNQSYAKGDFSIAMPPEAVVAYLKYIGFRNARVVTDASKKELVLGVADPGGPLKQYGGLCHYLYKNDPTIYSWARKFPSVEKAAEFAGKKYTVCAMISPHG